MDKQAIGDRIKLMRERKGWSQSDLATTARKHAPDGKRITRNSISQYENGHSYPDTWMLAALAEALETSVPFLTCLTDDPGAGKGAMSAIAPELWDVLQKINDQPPKLRKLAADVLTAAVEYAKGWASADSSSESGRVEHVYMRLDARPLRNAPADPGSGKELRQALVELLDEEVDQAEQAISRTAHVACAEDSGGFTDLSK